MRRVIGDKVWGLGLTKNLKYKVVGLTWEPLTDGLSAWLAVGRFGIYFAWWRSK